MVEPKLLVTLSNVENDKIFSGFAATSQMSLNVITQCQDLNKAANICSEFMSRMQLDHLRHFVKLKTLFDVKILLCLRQWIKMLVLHLYKLSKQAMISLLKL